MTKSQEIYRKYSSRGLAAVNRVRAANATAEKALERDRRYVYAIRAGENAVKIGFATNCEIRLSQISVGCPWPPVLVAQFSTVFPAADEKLWHIRLRNYNSNGEWFVMPERLANKVCELIGRAYVPDKNKTKYRSTVLIGPQTASQISLGNRSEGR